MHRKLERIMNNSEEEYAEWGHKGNHELEHRTSREYQLHILIWLRHFYWTIFWANGLGDRGLAG